MNKISVLAAAFALAGFTAQAQEAATPTAAQQPAQQEQAQGKQKIGPEELPDAVKEAIVTGEEYQGWTMGEAFKVQPAEDGAPATYEVQFINADKQPVTVRFDETGKKIES
ncbi:hypothetical protein [Pontibacter anaerobius]|uniref:PepSY domain-containing protein n=1 Tax=Pontibacter anaerobius TaxID=2993940 RepID=A0ABT3RFV1_9BACT|nr:hypothetical protein [Pontibacter anaerobius]MCX2740708.1 hypothetical protein [Pontibacter anaerobius]